MHKKPSDLDHILDDICNITGICFGFTHQTEADGKGEDDSSLIPERVVSSWDYPPIDFVNFWLAPSLSTLCFVASLENPPGKLAVLETQNTDAFKMEDCKKKKKEPYSKCVQVFQLMALTGLKRAC